MNLSIPEAIVTIREALRDSHAQLLARSISALTRCVRVVAEGTDGTREGAPDSERTRAQRFG